MTKGSMAKSLLTLVILTQSGSGRADETGWTRLFDGKTLEGWTVKGGQADYKVEGGAIVGTTAEGSPNTFLCKGDYQDFVLEFEVKCDPRLNSGVQVRSHVHRADDTDPEHRKRAGVVYGPQCEVARKETGTAGRFYDEGRRGMWLSDLEPEAKNAFDDDGWNHYRILVQGNRYRSWINGIAASSFADGKDERGLIGLQVHGIPKGEGPYQVRWRDVRIRVLTPGESVRRASSIPGELLRITTRSEWEKARTSDGYREDTLESEGFIHCASPKQLPWVVESLYKGRTGLVVLRIESSKLTSPLKWESPPDSQEKYPHIYGPINLDAVVEVVPLDDLLPEGSRDR